jgi:hypothetical protein
MKVINLTPYPIHVAGHDPIEPDGEVARVNAQTIHAGSINGMPCFETVINGASGVPQPKKDTVYIVPTMVRQAYPGRRDLVSPAKLLRDKSGVVNGCLGLEMNPKI